MEDILTKQNLEPFKSYPLIRVYPAYSLIESFETQEGHGRLLRIPQSRLYSTPYTHSEWPLSLYKFNIIHCLLSISTGILAHVSNRA